MNTEKSPESSTAAAQENPAAQASSAVPTRERNYIAFISYRHTPLDKEAAERVQKKIESYTIPKEFRSQYGGKKFGHAFRDEDELPTSASLTDSIYYALDHSKYLVVICTPNLPQSKWCEAEIRYFLKKHGRDRIIAVLADGSPEESFSPYMLHEFDSDGNPIADFEPLAANIAGPNHTINKKALNKEIVRLYATFLDCPFDSLWQRQRRARTNRLLSIAGIAIAVLCVFLAVVLNKNAQIEEQNEQIAAQNDQLTEKNEKIEEQNTELQSRLSSVLVDSGLTKLEQHDVTGALRDALSSMESGDPAIYDHRVGKLMSDTLGAYKLSEMRSSIVYEQPTGIERLGLASDKEHLLLLDSVGVLRCLDLATYDVLWEYPTQNKDSRIYTGVPGSRVIVKSVSGVFCLSMTDGAVLWSRPMEEFYGNTFQAISEDGTLFAMIEQDRSGTENDIIILHTEDGSELGRISLLDDEGFTPFISMISAPYVYAAAFSSDNSRFVYGIPGTLKESEEDVNCFYYVDLETFSKKTIGQSNSRFQYFYGIDIDPEDDSVFIAVYNASRISTILCTKNGDDYEFNDHSETHSFSSPGGISAVFDNFDKSECRYLSLDGRVYLFSDNQLYIYDRTSNTLGHNYSLSGKIINAYWADRENHTMELITDDAYIIDYYFDYGEGNILSGVSGEKADQSVISKICPAGNATVSKGGSYYNTSSDVPGRLYLVKFIADPNAESYRPSTYDYDALEYYEFRFPEATDYGVLFFDSHNVSTFDKRSGETVKTAKFEDYISAGSVLVIDDEHFLNNTKIYSLDGTVEEYASPVKATNVDDYPYNHIRLYNGQILSYKDIILYGYKMIEDSASENTGSYGSPQFCAVWMNGTPVSSLCVPENTVVFYEVNYDSVLTAVGTNGLILQRGNVIDIQDPEAKTYTVREKKELCFTDAVSLKTTFIEDVNPDSAGLKTAFAHQKHLCAAAYDDGTVCIYDTDSASARPLGYTYDANEVSNICFSSDDAFLLILTSAGRLDVFEVNGFNRTFSERIELYQKSASSLNIYDMTADAVGNAGILLVTINNNCVVLETGGWHEISEFSENSATYDPDTQRVYFRFNHYQDSSYSGSDIVSYPVYDIAKLKEWAEKEVAGK